MIRLYKLELEKECPFGKDVEKDLEVLLEKCRVYSEEIDEEIIKKTYYFCVDEFKDITRISGDLYYTHPLKVALIMFDELNYADNSSIAAALLHDVVEDRPEITKEIIADKFGADIANIVDGVTKIKGETIQKLDKAATYTKLFESLIKDVRVILIKLADRLDNMRTLHYMRLEKQKIIGDETLKFYTPFAQRLGLIKIKRKLEDLSLYFVDREKYEYIKNIIDEKQKDFLGLMRELESQISQSLDEKDIKHALALEHKHIYEIYRMIEQGNHLNEIDNFFSVVVKLMSNDYSECYRAYGIIANLLGPVRSFEDYISKPKINFYKALHSTHFTMNRRLVEIIIRTEEMDNLVETGMVGLLSIKSADSNLNFSKEDLKEWEDWMKDIVNEGEEDAMEKIWGTILMNLDSEYITVYTVDREMYHLPVKASPLDLAFAISENYGLHCVSAKVNGQLKSMQYELKDDDVVEIITSPNSVPDAEWSNYVVTFKAVVKLHKYFKNIGMQKETVEEPPQINEVKFRILGDDRLGMLGEITSAIGQINILRINLYKTAENLFEGIFTVNLPNEEIINELFVRLLSIKGMNSVEILEEDETL
jgi:RelA/SpoT family (p)ppGpp synthetase